MDSTLLQTVASEHFKIIAPMINALKSGLPRKIAQYKDLQPLEEHVQQALQTAQLHLEPQTTSVPAKANVSTPAHVSIETLMTKLKELGLAEDIAERMATKAQAEHPNASLLELVGLISAKLFERAPVSKPISPPHKVRAPRKNKALSQLEQNIAADRQAGKSAHASLREAGLVNAPQLDTTG